MGALLVRGWLAGVADEIPILDEASVSLVRAAVRRGGAEIGLPAAAVEALATAASELAHNQRKHARLGVVGVRAVARGGVAGLEVVAADEGDGLADPRAAFSDAPRSEGAGLGVGLAAALRLADELDVDTRRGEGTCVWARKFVRPVPRQEVGVFGRACTGEAVSGDHAAFVRDESTLLVGVFDGLGHGLPARQAADVAVTTLRARAAEAPADVIAACDLALETTRGGVMSVARFDARTRQLNHAGAGNIATRLYQAGVATGVLTAARVLGARHRSVRIPVETLALGAATTLLMHSDGLTSRTDLSQRLDLPRLHPILVAQEALERFGRADDDALVLVARLA